MHSVSIVFRSGENAGLNGFTDHGLRFARFLDPSAVLGNALKECADIGQHLNESGFWKAQSVFCQILDMLLNADVTLASGTPAHTYIVPARHKEPRSSDFVRGVQRFIQEHVDEIVSLDEIAHAMHVSVSQLSHRYRREAGEPPMVTRARLRLERVKRLLMLGRPLKTIAEQMGFCDIYHLSSFFKRMEGVPPTQFLRMMA